MTRRRPTPSRMKCVPPIQLQGGIRLSQARLAQRAPAAVWLRQSDILKPVEGLAFVYFDEPDVVRHHWCSASFGAYDRSQNARSGQQMCLCRGQAARSAERGSNLPRRSSGERNPIAEVASRTAEHRPQPGLRLRRESSFRSPGVAAPNKIG